MILVSFWCYGNTIKLFRKMCARKNSLRILRVLTFEIKVKFKNLRYYLAHLHIYETKRILNILKTLFQTVT